MQKSEELEDLRVRRTRKMLQEALIALTVEKGFLAVSVRDITERAMVNRSTFYRHYLDKYDLLNQYMDEVEALTATEIILSDKQKPVSGEVPSGLLNLLKHVQSFGDFYRVMLGQNGDARFTERFRRNVYKRFSYLISNFGIEDDPKAPPLELKLSYISCADIGAIMWWLENDQPCSVEQLAVWLGSLTSAAAGLPFKFALHPSAAS